MTAQHDQAAPWQLFDPLDDEAYNALKDDIRERGVQVPVELDEHGVILDGHHRVRAWNDLRAEGVKLPDYPTMTRLGLDDAAKRRHVFALNLFRRHLTGEARARAVRELRAGGMTLQEIARVAGVSEPTVRRDLSVGPETSNDESEPATIVNARGQQRPATYKPRATPTPTIVATTQRQRRGPTMIRPPDPSIKGLTLAYGAYRSDEAVRRYIHLAFRDAHTALDLTVASGGFWRPPVPPGLAVTTNNVDPSSVADLHLDFTATGLADESYDLVIYDPPHLADLGAESIMGQRFGSARGTTGLSRLVTAGVVEAWRIARVGILVKVADSSHGGEYLQLSVWCMQALGVQPYFVAHTMRGQLEDGKWKVQRVPRNNGADYLIFRKDGHQHRDFDRLHERQEARKAGQTPSAHGLQA